MTPNTEMMFRIANAKNEFQGDWPRVLCVCSAGLLRSPTLAWVLSNEPYNCNTRAAGSHHEYALIPFDAALYAWAQRIVFVNRQNYNRVKKGLGFDLPDATTYVLDVPDSYAFREPRLVESIKAELERVGFPRSPATHGEGK